MELNLDSLQTKTGYLQIRDSINGYIQNKLNIQGEYRYIELKQIPGVCNFYRFFYDTPFPFIVFYEEDYEQNSQSVVRGIERIPTLPTSAYYSDRLFAGFQDLSIASLQYDQSYTFFISLLLKSSYGFASGNYKEVAAFWQREPLALIYKVIYEMKSGLFLATFKFSYLLKEYTIESVESYKRQNEEGTYGWNCESLSQNGLCSKCKGGDLLLTSGRCYRKVEGCNLQVGASCQVCQSGYAKNNGACSKNPEFTIQKPKSVPCEEKTVITASSSKKIVYSTGTDIYCTQYQGALCTKCAYRFYLTGGVCEKVPDECKDYDEATGECFYCYSGFYLSNGICITVDPLCA